MKMGLLAPIHSYPCACLELCFVLDLDRDHDHGHGCRPVPSYRSGIHNSYAVISEGHMWSREHDCCSIHLIVQLLAHTCAHAQARSSSRTPISRTAHATHKP